MFNESTLVLEGVTLGEVVELVVEVLVDLSCGTVLYEKTAEDTETAHPEDLAVNNALAHCSGGDKQRSADVLLLLPRLIVTRVRSKLRTLAYAHQRYPSSYRNHGGGQFVVRRSGRGHGHASAW